MSTASTTLTQPTPQQLSHAVTEIGRLTLQGSSEVYSLGQLALAWLERPEGYRNLEVVSNALQAICGAAQRMEELVEDEVNHVHCLQEDPAYLRRMAAAAAAFQR